ncbi:hypothetical protein [Paenibacillus polymyxa]|uniref:hypothetical protein n=1 Tax=Paenibacillus polymyxa TaxID=1406 RepID=UPI00287F826B|nr:hypothetical protein [Paenibacillus polymyxa]
MSTTNINECSMHYMDSGEGMAILFIHPPVPHLLPTPDIVSLSVYDLAYELLIKVKKII